MTPPKRKRMGLVLRLYAEEKAYTDIMAETGLSKGAISGLLSEAEKAAGVRFIQRQAASEKKAIAEVTRTRRAVGKRAASIYDFHALRTTFVTLAISAGMNVDMLRAFTGHATVDIVLKHYFKAKATDFAKELQKTLPKILTQPARNGKFRKR